MRRRAWQLSARVVAAMLALVSWAAADAKLPPLPEGFVTQTGGWLQLEYSASARAKVPALVDVAESTRADLTRALGRPVLWEATARIARDPTELANLVPGRLPEGAEAAARPDFALVALSLETSTGAETHLDRSLRRELSALALHEATSGNLPPPWFALGFAAAMADEPSLSSSKLRLISATIRGKLMAISRLDQALEAQSSAPLARAQATDFVRFLKAKSAAGFANLIERLRQREPFAFALEGAFGEPMHVLEREWRDQTVLRRGYLPILAAIGLVGASAFGISAWRSTRRRRNQPSKAEPEPESMADEAAENPQPRGRVRLVLRRRSDSSLAAIDMDVPKVEHGGKWHTLH